MRARFGELFFKEVPQCAGVYFFVGEDGEILYIGKADDLRRRLLSYCALKPGRAEDHTLEMVDRARQLRWELHSSGKEALLRESELLHALKPPFNIAGTWGESYLSIGIRSLKAARSGSVRYVRMEFQLSWRRIGRDFQTFGCYKHRARVKAGYSALLRLLYVACGEKSRPYLPARLCQASPAYSYIGEIPADWIEPLESFLAGKSYRLLREISLCLLSKTQIPPFMYPGLQKDLDLALAFFKVSSRATRKIACGLGLKDAFVSPDRMDAHILGQIRPENV